MHAALFHDYGPPSMLRWEEVPDPRPGPGEVTVEVHACGLNHIDLDSRAGISRFALRLPHVLGAEWAGTIAEIGPGVTGWEVGQPVTALHVFADGTCARCRAWQPDRCLNFSAYGAEIWGGYAERVRAPAHTLIPLSGPQDFLVAATVKVMAGVAWHMVVTMAGTTEGQTVLVPSGSGGVAAAAIQIAKLCGARVIATAGTAARAASVAALGADLVLDYSVDDLREATLAFTGGEGVDAVIDTVGGPLFATHMSCLRTYGQFITCGAHAGEVVDLDIIRLFRQGHAIRGFRTATPSDIRHALQLGLEGRIAVPIYRTFPMREAAAAHELMARREHVGKIALVPA